jgi:hypothetical protein
MLDLFFPILSNIVTGVAFLSRGEALYLRFAAKE